VAADKVKASQAIDAYFALVGLETEGMTGAEQLLAYGLLHNLNSMQGSFAFQTQQGPEGKLPPYHYSGRYVAWWVHKMASYYGWARDDIFNLWPEEASAYLQEILIQEIEDFERQRSLSELSYSYDKVTQKSRFIPTPKPEWMVSGKESKTFRVRQDMMPVGAIIELDKLYEQDKA